MEERHSQSGLAMSNAAARAIVAACSRTRKIAGKAGSYSALPKLRGKTKPL